MEKANTNHLVNGVPPMKMFSRTPVLPISGFNSWGCSQLYSLPDPSFLKHPDLMIGNEEYPLADINEIDSILEMAENVLEETSISPTPIGPKGVEVVANLSLTDVNFASNKEEEANLLADLLAPLIKKRKREKIIESVDVEDNLLSSSSQHLCKKQKPFASFETSSQNERISPLFKKKNNRIRTYQADSWDDKLTELKAFRERFGNCLVPHNWSGSITLAQWVKRQRYQYKLKMEGRHSTLTDERLQILQELGFVWDSHGAAWEERLNELRSFWMAHNHCNVPSKYPENHQLSIWVKCQRRQYKLLMRGQRSNMTQQRINDLERLGFVWNPRNLDINGSNQQEDEC